MIKLHYHYFISIKDKFLYLLQGNLLVLQGLVFPLPPLGQVLLGLQAFQADRSSRPCLGHLFGRSDPADQKVLLFPKHMQG